MKRMADVAALALDEQSRTNRPSPRSSQATGPSKQAVARLAFELDLMFPGRMQVTEPLLAYWCEAFAEAKLSTEQVQVISSRVRASGAEHPPSLPSMIAIARGPRRINAAAYENKPLALPAPVNARLAREALDAMRRKLGQQEHDDE